jgi:NAD(P)-dependent dehydrogenase (short-subunit alcohol dehydrogenase family)
LCSKLFFGSEIVPNFTGKRALLAGAANAALVGVGRALHADGARLIVTDKSPLWGDLTHETAALDMLNPDALSGQVTALGDIDVLVFNAGWRRAARFLDHTPDDWDAAINSNFESPVFLAQAVAHQMIARGNGGRIIFLIGIEGLMPFAGTAAAGVSLTMLWGIARMIAVDLAPHNITVNLVTVGWTDVDALASLGADVQTHIVQGIPAARPGTPDDVGAAVAFLASEQAAYITGMVMPVDGGYLLTGAAGQTIYQP